MDLEPQTLDRLVETGAVVKVEDGQAYIRIRTVRGDACKGCSACQALGGGEFLLPVAADSLRPGDQVTVEVPLPSPWRGIGLVFALPLAVGLTGLLAGSAWPGFQTATALGPEAAGLALGGGLALAAFLLAIVEERRFGRAHKPRVLEVREREPDNRAAPE